jgi:hypothetical protein
LRRVISCVAGNWSNHGTSNISCIGVFPLPPETESSHRFIGRYGQLDVYIFNLYSIALSKIARDFESDLEDVQFLLAKNLIAWDEPENHFKIILSRARAVDIDPKNFKPISTN